MCILCTEMCGKTRKKGAGVADAIYAYSKYLDAEMKKQKVRNEVGENVQRGVRTEKRESGAGKINVCVGTTSFCWPTTDAGLRGYYNIARTKNARESRDNPTQIVVTKGPDGYSAIVEETAGSVGSSLFGVSTRERMEHRNTSKVHKTTVPATETHLCRDICLFRPKRTGFRKSILLSPIWWLICTGERVISTCPARNC